MRRYIVLWLTTVLTITGCSTSPPTPALPTLEFVTATLPPTATSPVTSFTSIAPTTAPTSEPIPGTTTSELNLRAEPSTASPTLGTIPAFSAVQVYGKESFGYWVRILFGGNSGWVRAEYVQVSAEIPVLDVEPGSGSGVRGAVLRGVNVRKGPGKDFDSLGLLNQYDVVDILGRDNSGEWLRIEFSPAAEGAGWVAAGYLETGNTDQLPVVANQQEAAQTEAPSQPASPGTGGAAAEGDSADAPLAVFTLSSQSGHSIWFGGEVSSADDAEDWVGFSSNFPKIIFQLVCDLGAAQAQISSALAAPVPCGGIQTLTVEPGRVYLVKISPLPGGNPDRAAYEIKVSAAP